MRVAQPLCGAPSCMRSAPAPRPLPFVAGYAGAPPSAAAGGAPAAPAKGRKGGKKGAAPKGKAQAKSKG